MVRALIEIETTIVEMILIIINNMTDAVTIMITIEILVMAKENLREKITIPIVTVEATVTTEVIKDQIIKTIIIKMILNPKENIMIITIKNPKEKENHQNPKEKAKQKKKRRQEPRRMAKRSCLV